MKTLKIIAGLVSMAVVAVAYAHAHLHSSTPADGSVVTSAPSSITLRFSEAGRVTAAWIQKDDEPKQKLGPLPETAAPEVSIPVPALSAGHYAVSWRVLSDDGHVMAGQIHFTLAPEGSHPPAH